MKTRFRKQNNDSRLLLFFAGWGMDYHVFPELDTFDGDVCICYDYSDMTFDDALFSGYRSIRPVAWSMGVWAASFVLQHKTWSFEKKTAVNGTLYPVDPNRGLMPDIYELTLQMLSEESVIKFYRRMCGNRAAFASFMEKKPCRDLESLRTELTVIREISASSPVPHFTWNEIFISENDLIFTTANQLNAWSGSNRYKVIPGAHYLPFDFVL